MKTLLDLYKDGSQSFRDRNPAILTHPDLKTRSSAKRGTRTGHSGIAPYPKKMLMNKTEAEFAQRLEIMRVTGEIFQWRFESVKIKLADGCWFTPDFFVEREYRPLFIEIKGRHIWDDAKVKFKTAPELHRWADYEMWQKKKSGWERLSPKEGKGI